MSEPYYTHPTVRAVASVIHDKLAVEGGVQLLRASSRVRMSVAGTEHDDARVAMALDAEGWIAKIETVEAIIKAVQETADTDVPR